MDGNTFEVSFYRLTIELSIRLIGLDCRYPLHDVKRSVPSVQAKVCTLGELSGVSWVKGELLGGEITNTELLSLDLHEHTGKTL